MDKIYKISGLVMAIIVNIILLQIFWQLDMKTKIIFIPFLIYGITMFLQTLSNVLNRQINKKIFKNIYVITFLTYWFGFIIFWSYLVIKNHSYFSLIFTIPFYIAGFLIIRKNFLKNKDEEGEIKVNKINLFAYLPFILIGLTLVVGIGVFSVGVYDVIKTNKTTKNYLETIGYFKDYEIDYSSEDLLYKLIYEYEVDDKTYSITTDYSTSEIPKQNSKIKIKYAENNPSNAIIVGSNRNNFMILFGLFFILGSLVFIMGFLSLNGYFAKFKIDVMGSFIGIVLTLVGFGLLYLNGSAYISLKEMFRNFNFVMFIAILFIVVGLFQFVKSLINKDRSKERKS